MCQKNQHNGIANVIDINKECRLLESSEKIDPNSLQKAYEVKPILALFSGHENFEKNYCPYAYLSTSETKAYQGEI